MKRVLILLVLAIAGGGGWYWWQSQKAVPSTELTLFGNVDIRDVDLGFRVAGRIATVHKDEGDTVKAGDKLSELDKEPFLEAIARLKADVATAKANHAKLDAGMRPEEIAQARSAVEERKAALSNAEVVLNRQDTLRDRGYASQQIYDEALRVRDEARARLASSDANLKLVTAGYRKEDIAAAAATLDAAEARLAEAMTQLADADLEAPSDGVILTRAREAGAIVASGASVFTLSLIKPVYVRTYVSEPDLGRIHPGMIVTVATDTPGGKTYSGQIGFISPTAEFTPKSVETTELRTDLVYRLRVVVGDSDEGLRQGMPVTVRAASPIAEARVP